MKNPLRSIDARHFIMLPEYKNTGLPSCHMEVVTPDEAVKYLKRNTHNRKISASRVAKLCKILRAGEMRLNGDTIRFDWNGTLLDGQHRLTAVAQTGIPIVCYIVRDLDPSVFTTIDVNKPRGAADILSIMGKENSTKVAAALRLVNESRLSSSWSGPSSGGDFTNEQVKVCWEEHPEIEESCLFILGKGMSRVRKFMAPGPAIFMHYWLSKINRDKAYEFFNMVESGEYIYRGHPVMTLRNVFIENEHKSSRDKISRARVIAYTFKAWNAFVAGEEKKQLKLGASEKFPTPGGE